MMMVVVGMVLGRDDVGGEVGDVDCAIGGGSDSGHIL